MTFVEAVEASERLRPHLLSGLQAVNEDAFIAEKGVRCDGSVNLEKAYPENETGVRRWDYAIGVSNHDSRTVVVWLEPHSARSGRNRKEVFEKLDWLIVTMRRDAQDLVAMPEHVIVWLAQGGARHTMRDSRLVEERGIKVKSGRIRMRELMGWSTYGFPRR